MPAPADEPLERCNLNLYARDKEWMFKRYGHGWSEVVRRLVREHRREHEERILEWPSNNQT